jgi:glutamine phosphoribosylpyrophosphate amidotransferase
MPTRAELIAAHRSEDEVPREIGADALVYQGIGSFFASVLRNARGCGVFRVGERCFSL